MSITYGATNEDETDGITGPNLTASVVALTEAVGAVFIHMIHSHTFAGFQECAGSRILVSYRLQHGLSISGSMAHSRKREADSTTMDSQAVTHLACGPAKTRALASSQEEPGFWISVVLVQARFDYRFFLFAKFPVIEPCFIVEFIQLRPNLLPLFRTELRQCFEDLGLDNGGNLPRPPRGRKHAFEQETVPPLPCSPSSILAPITPIINVTGETSAF